MTARNRRVRRLTISFYFDLSPDTINTEEKVWYTIGGFVCSFQESEYATTTLSTITLPEQSI